MPFRTLIYFPTFTVIIKILFYLSCSIFIPNFLSWYFTFIHILLTVASCPLWQLELIHIDCLTECKDWSEFTREECWAFLAMSVLGKGISESSLSTVYLLMSYNLFYLQLFLPSLYLSKCHQTFKVLNTCYLFYNSFHNHQS